MWNNSAAACLGLLLLTSLTPAASGKPNYHGDATPDPRLADLASPFGAAVPK
jgi:hypothetical protein